MRIALIADIHGNLPAFETVLAAIGQHAPDLLVIAGDVVVGSPDSRACWQLAQSLNCPILRGNHERYLSLFGTKEADPLWSTEQFGPVQWAVAQFRDSERATIAALPLVWHSAELPDLLVTHASPRSDTESLPLHTTPDQLDLIFADTLAQTIVRGHNHVARTQPWGARQIITVGSAGLPLEGRLAAQYVILDQVAHGWLAQHHSIEYPVEKTLQRFASTDYVAKTGPMGRLFQREVATASLHFIPFLRYYRLWCKREPDLQLAPAVERFLTSF